MNEEEMLTFIIPSRKYDDILENCINKIRELYKTVKIILILDELNKTDFDENIKVIKSENPNMSAKRNAGVKAAETKYIELLDSDAYPVPGQIEKAIDFLEKNNDYAAVTGKQYNFPTDNFVRICLRLLRYSSVMTHKEWQIITDADAKDVDCGEFSSANVIMRRDVYISENGMNEDYYLAEDNEFSQRLNEKNYKFRFIPEVAVYHRECDLYPFLRKYWCMSYYYANRFIKGKSVKTPGQTVTQFLPLAGIIFFCLLWGAFVYLKINPYPLLLLPLAAFAILAFEAANLTKKLNENKIKGFFIMFVVFCLFVAVWVTASLAGLLCLPCKSVQSLYKHR